MLKHTTTRIGNIRKKCPANLSMTYRITDQDSCEEVGIVHCHTVPELELAPAPAPRLAHVHELGLREQQQPWDQDERLLAHVDYTFVRVAENIGGDAGYAVVLAVVVDGIAVLGGRVDAGM